MRYDLRGQGRSGKAETSKAHTSELYANDFMAVVSEFGLRNPILAGWSVPNMKVSQCSNAHGCLVFRSFGGRDIPIHLSIMSPITNDRMENSGQVAIDVAANISPLPISGVFYINSTSISSVSGRPIMREIMTLEADLATSAQALKLMRRTCFEAPNVSALSFYEDCFMAGIQTMQSYNSRHEGMRRKKNPEPYLVALKEGKVKVFVCYGVADQLLDGTILSKEMIETAKYVQVKAIENGSHVVFMQYPKEVAKELIGFVEGLHVD